MKLKSSNGVFGTNYRLSKIYYCPYEKSTPFTYEALIRTLIKHYHEGKEFKEF
jgi:hypothetical protein